MHLLGFAILDKNALISELLLSQIKIVVWQKKKKKKKKKERVKCDT